MRPNPARRRRFGLATLAVLVVAACGGDDDTTVDQPSDESPVEQDAEQGLEPDAAEPTGEMTVPGLCLPVRPSVLAVLGDDVTTTHNDFYADRADRILDCAWESDTADRTIRVGYNGAPSDLMVDLSDGKQDLAGVDAPNVYATSRTDLQAPNGWTITIQNLGADATDDTAAMAAIANAALAAVAGS